MQAFAYMAYLMLDLFICLDLILIIRNPFGSKENRVTKYLIISYSFALFNAAVFIKTNAIGSIFQLCVEIVYLIVAIFSIFFCFYRLYYSGLSK